MRKKLQKILLENRNAINKTKLERILASGEREKTKFDRKNKEFEDKYQRLKSQYTSTDDFSRQLLKDNIKLADKYVKLDYMYKLLETEADEKEREITLQKKEIEALSEKLADSLKKSTKEYKPKHAKDGPMEIIISKYKPRHAVQEDLEEKVDIKGIPEVDLNKYHTERGYYSRITNIVSSNNSSLTKVVKILSGDYVKENGKRAWTWEDRENEIRKYYNSNHIEYTNHDKQKLEKIVGTVRSNKYARSKHERKLRRIYSIIKTPNESKLVRFFKTGWRKLSDHVKEYTHRYKR